MGANGVSFAPQLWTFSSSLKIPKSGPAAFQTRYEPSADDRVNLCHFDGAWPRRALFLNAHSSNEARCRVFGIQKDCQLANAVVRLQGTAPAPRMNPFGKPATTTEMPQ